MSAYRQAWFFQHRELPVSLEDLEQIKPLAENDARQLWRQWISQEAEHSEAFAEDDWPSDKACWQVQGNWQSAWDREADELPEEIAQFIDWEGHIQVFFFYSASNVIQTSWQVFARNWKNFLFLDNGPLLLGKKRKQVVQFHTDGQFQLGQRP